MRLRTFSEIGGNVVFGEIVPKIVAVGAAGALVGVGEVLVGIRALIGLFVVVVVKVIVGIAALIVVRAGKSSLSTSSSAALSIISSRTLSASMVMGNSTRFATAI